MANYAVSIDGFPYLLADAGVTALPTSTDADWSPDWTLASGYFDRAASRLAWGERLRPLDGDLEYDGLTFVLHDSPKLTGSPLLTSLLTKRRSRIESTVLASDFLVGDMTFDVLDGTVLTDMPRVLWINREAVYCEQVVGNTVTVAAGGRGYFGTREADHLTDAADSFSPEVYPNFPGAVRRRAILWRVSSANVAAPIWRGYASRAPKSRGGVQYDLQCEGVWTHTQNLPLGMPRAATYLRGFDVQGISAEFRYDGLSGVNVSSFASTGAADVVRFHATFNQLLNETARLVRNDVSRRSITATTTLSGGDGGATLRVQMNGVTGLTATLRVGTTLVSAQSASTTDPRLAFVTARPAPPTLVLATPGRTDQEIPVDGTQDFPAAWAGTPVTDDTITTQTRVVLRGPYSDEEWLTLIPESHADSPPRVTGELRLTPRKPVGEDWQSAAESITGGYLIDRAVPLRVTANVTSGHFVYAFKYAIEDTDGLVRSGADPRDWDFSDAALVVNVTGTPAAARSLYFDGSQKLGSILDPLALHGCGLAVREGARLAIVPFRVPLPTDSVVATLTPDDVVTGHLPEFTTLPDGLINYAEISADQLTIVVRDQRSVGRYSFARDVKLRLPGTEETGGIVETPREIANYVLSRVLGLWSEECEMATLVVNLSWLTTIYLGDFVQVDGDWLLPDGDGGRGWDGVRAQVIGRQVDLSAGTITLELLRYGIEGVAGYAPAARITSRASAVLTLAAPGYVNGTSDYAGSERAAYRGTANDGGASFFVAGSKVRARRIDTTADTFEDMTVLSVNAATREVTMTAAPAFTIGAGELWDLEYSPYDTASILAAQKQYAFVGDDATGVIAGTTDANRVWSP